MLGVDELRGDASVFKRLERGKPVHPGGLEHRRFDLVPAKPVHQPFEPLAQGTEHAGVHHRLASLGCTKAHRGGDLHLVNVQPRGARMDNVKHVAHDGPLVGSGAEAGRVCACDSHLGRAAHFAVRPRPGAGYIAGLGSADRGQFGSGDRARPGRQKLIRPLSRLRPHLDPPHDQAQPRAAPYQLVASPPATAPATISCPSGWAGNGPRAFGFGGVPPSPDSLHDRVDVPVSRAEPVFRPTADGGPGVGLPARRCTTFGETNLGSVKSCLLSGSVSSSGI